MTKLIILQDSKIPRQIEYFKKINIKIEDYSFLEIVTETKDILDKISNKPVSTILAHVSDLKKEPKIEHQIIKHCEKNKVDLVYFTGDQNKKRLRMNQYPTASISADELYSGNLILFLNHAERNYNLGYLIFGEHFILNQLLNFRMYLSIIKNSSTKHEEIYDVLEKKVDIDELLKFLSFPTGKSNFHEIVIEKLSLNLTKKINDIVLYSEVSK